MNQRVLCVWLPNWPIQRVHAVEPCLAGQAVVLEKRDARRGLLIAAANLAARRAGAHVGMRLSELAALCSGPSARRATPAGQSPAPAAPGHASTARATTVASKAPIVANATQADSAASAASNLLWQIRPFQPDEDLDRLCELAEEAQQFSPLVGLELHDDRAWYGRTTCLPQALFLDISGIGQLFGGEEQLLVEVAQWLRSQRYFAYMSIASTVGAAWALANYEILRRVRQASKEAAAAGAEPPPAEPADVPDCRTLITEAWEEAELLSALPVAALRIDEDTVGKLQRLGVRSLNQLWQLPRDGLSSRLGSQLLKRSDQALGNHAEPIIALHSAPDWSLEFALENPTRDQSTLAEVLLQLCAQLANRLRAGGQGALRCVCRLDLVRSRPLVMQLGLFRASDDADHLHALLVGQLEQTLLGWQEEGLGHDLAPSRGSPAAARARKNCDSHRAGPLAIDDQGAVWRVCLQATLTAPIVWEQSQLFDEPDLRQRQQLAQLIDNLSSRLGRGHVLEARVERDAEPDQAVSYRPLTGRRTDGTEQKTLRKLNSRLASSGAEPRPDDPLRRPTRLLTPPELLVGTSSPPGSPPTEFVFENRRQRVLKHWGPERLESGWWRGPSTRREYYRVETAGGDWWWIFHDVISGNWYMHGLFG